MMQRIALEAIRWQNHPTGAEIQWENGRRQVRLQVLSRISPSALCVGRPVEELPRILPILSPAHHLAAAATLDQLFRVDPPELAQTMRSALLTAQTLSAHLRKLSFLFMGAVDPFADPVSPQRGGSKTGQVRQMLNEAMHHLALSREAEAILGGRHHHPLSAVAGGVSRFLKEPHYARLERIAESCLDFVKRLADFMRDLSVGAGSRPELVPPVSGPSMKALSLDQGTRDVVLHDAEGREIDRFSPQAAFARIELRKEPWTYAPFAFLQKEGWKELAETSTDHLFFVGPLARFNAGRVPATPLAEAEYQHFVSEAGPFPRFEVQAAYRALLIELIQQAEEMQQMWTRDNLAGPSIRTPVPAGVEPEREAWGVVDAPDGVILHHVQVDERARVREIEVMDTTAANQAMRCLLAGRAIGEMTGNIDYIALNQRIALAILPF